jgi:hypothetical protein
MRTFCFAVSFATLAACSPAPADTAQEAAQPVATAVAPARTAGIDGWEIDMTAYSKVGTLLPAYVVKQPNGTDATPETLRGHWTILGVWPDVGATADEANFAAALSSAADQDPDLEVLIVQPGHEGAAPATQPQYPVLIDDGTISKALAAPALPAYLLIGPDLTIEGYRGALTATPDNGIKSVIQGVSEVRKQIAAPQ